jgi:hypothetical protein
MTADTTMQLKWKRKLHQKLKVKQSRDLAIFNFEKLDFQTQRTSVTPLWQYSAVINLKQPNIITLMWERTAESWCHFMFCGSGICLEKYEVAQWIASLLAEISTRLPVHRAGMTLSQPWCYSSVTSISQFWTCVTSLLLTGQQKYTSFQWSVIAW